MSEVFLSYKSEDEARVVRLVQALEHAGHAVWWDRGLAVGENWRIEIQNALNAASCAIVVWTHGSIGPLGDFVRDEAGQAKRCGILVPVLLDKVTPPVGFGEIQAVDLTHWKGSRHDPFFEDLLAAVTAKLEGRSAPPAKGPTKRLMKRLTYSGFASALAFGGLSFGLNLFHGQEQVCNLPLLQPSVSDVCGALGLGHRPVRNERIAWEARPAGSCPASAPISNTSRMARIVMRPSACSLPGALPKRKTGCLRRAALSNLNLRATSQASMKPPPDRRRWFALKPARSIFAKASR